MLQQAKDLDTHADATPRVVVMLRKPELLYLVIRDQFTLN